MKFFSRRWQQTTHITVISVIIACSLFATPYIWFQYKQITDHTSRLSIIMPTLQQTNKAARQGMLANSVTGEQLKQQQPNTRLHIMEPKQFSNLEHTIGNSFYLLLSFIALLIFDLIFWIFYYRAANRANYQRQLNSIAHSKQRVKRLTYYDKLTRLPNRTFFQRKIKELGDIAAKTQLDFAVLYIDIDNFKRINNTLGHQIGDTLLQTSAKRMTNILQSSNNLARINGDEFAIINAAQTVEESIELAQKLLDTFSFPFMIKHQVIQVSISIGIAHFSNTKRSVADTIRFADIAMRHVKKDGGSGYHVFTSELQTEFERCVKIEELLPLALENNEFKLVYQPQHDLKTGKVVGAEALLRWESSELGDIQPKDFIPIAEASEIILPLGEWLIERACYQLKEWLGQQPEIMRDFKLSINISVVQLENRDISDILNQILNEIDIPRSNITVEMTETSLLSNQLAAHKSLEQLRQNEINVSLDDFGTGYSSVSLLHNNAIRELKIDISFIRDILTNPDSYKLVKGIIALANALDLDVVAEGIEDKKQADVLQALNCDVAQGYYFSPPIKPEELLKYIAHYNRQKIA